MKVIVFGSAGKVGRLVVERLLEEGHSVSVFVHTTNPYENVPAVTVIKGTISSPADVARAVDSADVVVSTLGSWGAAKKDVLSQGMVTILPAMKTAGVSRIISLTGADAWCAQDKPNLFRRSFHKLLNVVAHDILQDSEKHIALLESSGARWTVLRSPVMRSFGPFGRYTITRKPLLIFKSAHRLDVAAAIVELVTSHDYDNAVPFIIS